MNDRRDCPGADAAHAAHAAHSADSALDASKHAESPYKSLGGPRRIWNALGNSLRGLTFAFRVESSFRQELALAALLIPAAIALRAGPIQTVALIGSVLLVLIVELLNSSIESTVDRISLDHHRLSGRAKDLGSAAVLLALVLCFVTWVLLAGPPLVLLAAKLR